MKKVLSVVLALALVLAIAVPTFATPNVDDQTKMASGIENTMTGGTKVPAIKVTVPTSGAVVLNPYSMGVKIGADGAMSDNGTANITGNTVISPTYRITSQSDVEIKVNASVTGEVPSGSEAAFAAATTHGAKPTTTKSVYLVMDFVNEAPADAVSKAEPATWGVSQSKDSSTGVISYTGIDRTKNITISKSAQVLADAGILAKTDGTKFSAVAFHVIGDAASAPTNGWKSTDTVNVKTTFTFVATA